MTYKRKPKPCLICKKMYMPSGNCSKFCKPCGVADSKEKMKQYHKENYVRKGYNQSGANNNHWRGGIGIYRKLKPPTICELCSSKKNLVIHHKDENRRNNALENLQCLCKRCHQIEHKCWIVLPRGDWLSLLKAEQARNARRSKAGKFKK